MTGELLLRVAQSTILLPELPRPHHFRHRASINRAYALSSTNRSSPSICAQRPHRLQHQLLLKCAATADAARVDYSDFKQGIEIEEPDTGGGGGGGGAGGEGGGGGGDDSKDSNEREGGSEESDSSKKMEGMSMSQKLTLAYAALVGVGGLMGYLKSGSMKSLAAGGLSAFLLAFIYTELPTRPVFASSLGFGISAALLVVMGSRFKNSGKIFPAGVVSFVSLVMTGGYLHGILRSLH